MSKKSSFFSFGLFIRKIAQKQAIADDFPGIIQP